MANPKTKTEESKPPVTGPVADAPNNAQTGTVTGDGSGKALPEIGAQAGAVTGDGTGTALPTHEGGATIEAVGDSATAADAGGTSDVVGDAGATIGQDGGQPLPEFGGSPDVSSINDAAFDQVMKRFVSQGKTVVVKGPEKGRWRAGRHFTMEPTSIPLIDLTEAELEKLVGDPLLTVGIVDAPY